MLRTHACLVASILLSSLTAYSAEEPLVDAVELRARGGLPNAMARLDAGQELRVAYIGGSITAADGWRPKTTAWLQQQYPESKIVEINAAIGGTGSDLGVFRFRQDVLQHKPHFIFVEFAVNDGGAPPAQIIRCMEGMVRQAWREDPSIDICFVYTLVDGWYPTLKGGKLVRSATAMEKVADHYQIPTIYMGQEVIRLASEGKLVLKANPKTEAEKQALAGKMIFSSDGVHPHADTGHQLYLEAIARSFAKMKGNATPRPHKLAEPLMVDNYERARLVPISTAKLSDGWVALENSHPLVRSFHKFLPQLQQAAPGQTLEFQFKGTLVGAIDLLGPDCGFITATVDGGKPREIARFDRYCTYHRIGSVILANALPDGLHTVKITVSGKSLDKPAILALMGNKMDNPKRFDGKNWYASSLMIIGEPVERK